jgi:drug/metabolite transporter (DMT)-like permease
MRSLFLACVPGLFVFLWSTGWINARAAAPYADPLLFLVIRFGLAAMLMAALCTVLRATWPATRAAAGHAMVSGVLLHAGYLGPVWWAVSVGVPAGVSGVLAALQPLLTALLAPALLRETVTRQQWLGIATGFVGILLVLSPKFAGIGTSGLADLRWPLIINTFGMVSVTLGTFYQKRYVGAGDLRSVATLQYVGATLAIVPFMLALEPMRFEVNAATIAAMAWSVIAISIAGILLLLWLIREGAVARTATLIYLVPPVVVVEAWLLFGETINSVQMLGVAIVCAGVALAVRR